MKSLFIAIISILALALASPTVNAKSHQAKTKYEQQRDSKHKKDTGNECDDHEDRDRHDGRDDDEDDDDDHSSGCHPVIPTPVPGTPPTAISATFLSILPAVPSSSSIASTLGNVSQFYTPSAWNQVIVERNSHGAIVSEVPTYNVTQGDIFGIPGPFNMITYMTRFADGSIRLEVVGMKLGADGVWRVAYYSLEELAIAAPVFLEVE